VLFGEYILARNKPNGRVKILLIAESPPASGEHFYIDRATGTDSLFRETMKALGLFPEDMKMSKGFDKLCLLKEFQSQDFFVIDASYKPVNRLKPKERKLHHEGNSKLIADTHALIWISNSQISYSGDVLILLSD
jgi:hypothetical protein